VVDGARHSGEHRVGEWPEGRIGRDEDVIVALEAGIDALEHLLVDVRRQEGGDERRDR